MVHLPEGLIANTEAQTRPVIIVCNVSCSVGSLPSRFRESLFEGHVSIVLGPSIGALYDIDVRLMGGRIGADHHVSFPVSARCKLDSPPVTIEIRPGYWDVQSPLRQERKNTV